MELREQDGTVTIAAALPGVDAKHITVEITPQGVVIKASSEHEHAADKGQIHSSEFTSGQIFRSLPFPKAVDAMKAKAEYQNGMLNITVPIATEPEPRASAALKASQVLKGCAKPTGDRRLHSGGGWCGKVDRDGRAATRRAGNSDMAAMRFNQALGRRQPETGSPRFGGEERREDLLPHFRGNPRTAIAERNLTGIVQRRERDANRALSLHRLRAVDQQVFEHNGQEAGIGLDGLRGSVDVHLDVLKRGITTEQVRRRHDQGAQLHRRRLGLRRPRKQQEILHELVQRVNARRRSLWRWQRLYCPAANASR